MSTTLIASRLSSFSLVVVLAIKQKNELTNKQTNKQNEITQDALDSNTHREKKSFFSICVCVCVCVY